MTPSEVDAWKENTLGFFMIKVLKVKNNVFKRAMGEKRNTPGNNLIHLKLML